MPQQDQSLSELRRRFASRPDYAHSRHRAASDFTGCVLRTGALKKGELRLLNLLDGRLIISHRTHLLPPFADSGFTAVQAVRLIFDFMNSV